MQHIPMNSLNPSHDGPEVTFAAMLGAVFVLRGGMWECGGNGKTTDVWYWRCNAARAWLSVMGVKLDENGYPRWSPLPALLTEVAMLLSELDFAFGGSESPACVIDVGEYRVLIVNVASDPPYYNIFRYRRLGILENRWLQCDALTAQAILFEVTKDATGDAKEVVD